MRRPQTGQASIEWLAAALIALALLAALAAGLRGAVDPAAVIGDAMRAVGLSRAQPEPTPPALLIRGRPGQEPVGRIITGGGRATLTLARASTTVTLRAGRGVVRAVGPQAAAFARGFRRRLEEIIVSFAAPPSLRSTARRALNGLWEATPYAQAIRNAISGGRIVLAGIRGRSLQAASEQAGRESADRVVGFLTRTVRSRLRGDQPPRDPGDRGGHGGGAVPAHEG